MIIRDISTLSTKTRLSLPSSLYRVSTPSDFDRWPETAKVCLFLHMDSLYNEFILQRILVQRTSASTEKLIAVAHELLDNLLLLIANRAVGGGDGNSVVWIVCFPFSFLFSYHIIPLCSIYLFLSFFLPISYGAVHSSELKVNEY